ncbi:APC family permease [Pseudoclavibacter chungangensis]|uniref:APC family permease n=1 Tax=Pseudoclavibacter chungangensis TaxID=587635 RepID=A0A7J5BR67_9MICO|nr:APC family permease [Pseudoclavibacter chungangensis]KAB1656802.1 APC family permease [Pseudoclavibacter chungangensis]NYJ67251.1 amino acid transporter [Pseudoclavibacter chungangensis]
MTTTSASGGDAPASTTPRPSRRLRVWEVAAISIGFMGPVMAMSLNGIGVAGLVGKAVPFTFLVAFLGTLLVAYAFIRLTRYITHAGSVYALAGSTIGPRAGFFGGFALLGTYLFFAACIAGACAVFFEALMSELGVELPSWVWLVVMLVSVAASLVLNLRESVVTARTLLGIGFAGIIAMVVLAFIIIGRVGAGDAPVSTGIDLSVLLPGDASFTAVMTASVFAFLSWAGFESGTSLGEEAREPKRAVPVALLSAVVVGGCIYVLVMFAQTIGFGTDAAGVDAFANASSTLTTLASTYIGPWYAVLVSVIAFFVAFASLLSSSAAASRLLFALARDGFGPVSLGTVHPRTGVPTRATIVIAIATLVLACGLGLAGGTSVDVYYWFATIATLCMVVAYGMASVGVVRYMFKPGSRIPRWEVVVPLLGLAYLVLVYAIQIIGQEAPYTYFPWIAGAWCLLGLVLVLARPGLAKRIGERLTTEDLE